MSRRRAATTTKAAALRAETAAGALIGWLQIQRTRTASHRRSVDPASDGREAFVERPDMDPQAGLVEPDLLVAVAGRSGMQDPDGTTATGTSPLPTRRARASAQRLEHTDWLHHRLLITGPKPDLDDLRGTAGGAGTVPWHLDFDRVEEDLFHLLVAPPAHAGRARSLSLAGARVLAGQLRTAAERRHALAIARVGHSRVCPFDLHALVPVPDPILRCGPDDPEALDWLWTNWGTTEMLRLVAEGKGAAEEFATRRPAVAGQGVWALTFWSADWTPWRALARVAGRWPTLRFETRPIYDMP
jgi:hypothetical protein